MKKILLVILTGLLGACASKTVLDANSIQNQTRLGMSSADALAVLGLPQTYLRLADNNRILIYNQSALYFTQDQLTQQFELNSPLALNHFSGSVLPLSCESIFIEPQKEAELSLVVEELARQLKQNGYKLDIKEDAKNCKLQLKYTSEAISADFNSSLKSVSDSADYNSFFYRSSNEDPMSQVLKINNLNFVKKIELSFLKNKKNIGQSQTQSASSFEDENSRRNAAIAGAVMSLKQQGSGSDLVSLNDPRLKDISKSLGSDLKNKTIFSQDKDIKKVVNPYRAFAYLGDEASFIESLKLGFKADEYSTDNNAFCLAQRAYFVKALGEILNTDVDLTISLKDHRKGRLYISGKDCLSLIADKEKSKVLTQMIVDYESKKQKLAEASLKSGDTTARGVETMPAASGDTSKSKGINWDGVWEFLKPQVPEQKK